jgi:hypothetical protein
MSKFLTKSHQAKNQNADGILKRTAANGNPATQQESIEQDSTMLQQREDPAFLQTASHGDVRPGLRVSESNGPTCQVQASLPVIRVTQEVQTFQRAGLTRRPPAPRT